MPDFPIKLTIGFALVVCVLGATALVALQQLSRSDSEREATERESATELMLAERLHADVERMIALGRAFAITGNPGLLAPLDEARSSLDAFVDELEVRAIAPQAQQLLRRVGATKRQYEEAMNRVVAARQRSPNITDEIAGFERDASGKQQELGQAIDAFVQYKGNLLQAAYATARGNADRAFGVGVAAVLIAMGVVSALAGLAGRRLVRAYARERTALQSAERAVAARDELVSVVAHDLRSPLSAISMKATLLRKTSSDVAAQGAGTSIENIAMRMESVISSLLDAASIEAGRFSVRAASCDAGEILRDAEDMFGSLASSKSIRLTVRSTSDLAVRADKGRVLQVLSNLIGNAVRATPVGGQIDVSAERTASWICFAVADTGPGLAAEHLGHAFERYWRGDVGGTKGTGLGLYISKGIVEAHGGTIQVENSDRGATFRFLLPAAQRSAGEGPQLDATGAPRGGQTTDRPSGEELGGGTPH